jgi:hypothetical protein
LQPKSHLFILFFPRFLFFIHSIFFIPSFTSSGGGSRVVGENDTLLLDGSRSLDPDRTSDSAVYNWQCFDADDNPCFEPDSENPGRLKRMVIPSGIKATIIVAQTLKTNSK